jgi:mRNA interferase RelE/StbE
MFRVEAKRRVLRALERFTLERKNRVKEVISTLKSDPIPFRRLDVAKLRGYENTYRIRVGDLRIVYEVNWDKKRILIHFIGSRERAYE